MYLNLSKCVTFSNHRSGWAYALQALNPIHSLSGLYFEGFLERSFCWEYYKYINEDNPNKLPYKHPWVGFIHNPHNMPFFLTILALPK